MPFIELTKIYRPIRSPLQAVESLLVRELIFRKTLRNGLLGELTRHVVRMTGKRLRPALALLGAGVAGASWRSDHAAVRLAAAVEMIHTATLLHDDVIDGATLRRGLTTLNAKWGDTLSVLSGDYLYSKAFRILSELDHPRVLRLMSDTAQLVCEGEISQIQHQYDLALNRSAYLRIIEWKTASLMGAAAEAGALLEGAAPAQARRLGLFGTQFGLAFQILDDTQDLVGEEDQMGKSLGTDLALGQMTLPLLYLRDRAEPELRSELSNWFSGNGSRSSAQAQGQMQRLKREAVRHKVPAYCRRVANQYLVRARSALAPFPTCAYKESLLALTDFILQ